MNISVWFETFTMVLSGVSTSKITRIMIRSRALYFGCAMFDVKIGGIQFSKLLENPCNKG
jgi:hypothetical protein